MRLPMPIIAAQASPAVQAVTSLTPPPNSIRLACERAGVLRQKRAVSGSAIFSQPVHENR